MSERNAQLTNDQRSALLGLLTALDLERWTVTTAVRGWSVHDVVAHLIEGELLFGRIYRGELKALTREDADPQAGVDRWTRADGETLRYSLWHHGSATQRVIDSRSEASWDRELAIFERLGRLGDVLALHFFDLALHSLDISTALGAESLWGERAADVAAYCVAVAPAFLEAAGIGGGPGLTVSVVGAGTWTLARRGGTWSSEPSADGDVIWETDAETLVLATTRRLSADAAIERTVVKGDPGRLAEVLGGWQVKRA